MGVLSFILDIYENTRKTKTEVKPSKPLPRKYNFEAGFTGNKKDDCNTATKSVKKQKREEKSERDDR